MTPEQEKLLREDERDWLANPSITSNAWLAQRLIEEREAHKRTEGFLEVERNNHKVSIMEWEKAEAELADIKAGKGWYEITPGGQKKHCWTSDEEELKSARAELAEARKALSFAEKMRDSFTHTVPQWDKATESAIQRFNAAINAAMQSNSAKEYKK